MAYPYPFSNTTRNAVLGQLQSTFLMLH